MLWGVGSGQVVMGQCEVGEEGGQVLHCFWIWMVKCQVSGTAVMGSGKEGGST